MKPIREADWPGIGRKYEEGQEKQSVRRARRAGPRASRFKASGFEPSRFEPSRKVDRMRDAMKFGDRPKRIGPKARIDWLAVLAFLVGVALVAVGLELFLKPNRLVAGGAQGLSIMLSHVTEMQMGLILFLINVPFLFLAQPGSGKRSALVRFAALVFLSIVTLLLDPIPPLTEHSLAASLLGGLALGCGAGLILKIGGYTDGVHEAAYWMKRKVPLSIAEIVMLVNLIILALAGFLFGWEQALYSIIAYYAAYQSLRFTIRGSHRYTLIRIQGERLDAVRDGLRERFGPECSFMSEPSGAEAGQITVIISRQKESRLLDTLREIAPAATISMTPITSAKSEAYKYLP